MIGQEKNLETIRQWRFRRVIPRFIILTGNDSASRCELAEVIAKQTDSIIFYAGTGVNDVREVISASYTITDTTTYIFKDCDTMSIAAKNSLLKVVEEPPNNARFIMTVEDTGNMLPTILSRATVMSMQPVDSGTLYISSEYKNIAYMIKSTHDTEKEQIEAIQRAVALSQQVINHIANRSMSKVLLELTKLSQKDGDGGVDIELFLRAFRHDLSLSYIPSAVIMKSLPYITRCSSEQKRTGVNKLSSVEVMCINIVEEYKQYAKV